MESSAVNYSSSDQRSISLEIEKLKRQINDLEVGILRLSQMNIKDEVLWVSNQEHTKAIKYSAVVMIQSRSNYSTIYCLDGSKYFTSKTLKSWASKIGERPDFARVHSSFLVNTSHIDFFNKELCEIQMVNGLKAKCSRRIKTNHLFKKNL